MASGTYGTIRPSDVDPKDVEILYHFSSDRTNNELNLKKLNSSEVLIPLKNNLGTNSDEILGGLYNLKLKSTDFNQLGYYTIYIRPKQIRTTITDCGILSSLPSVRGLIIDLNNVDGEDKDKFSPQGLVGYRIEYINPTDNQKVRNFFRIVTSSFYCSPVISNVNNTSQKSIRYQYSNTPTNYIFLTVTPSSAPSNKPNSIPFIGQTGQTIILNNTFVNPTSIEVNVVEHDETTLAYALYGNQSKSLDNGIYTIYDKENKIYKQYNLYEIKDQYNETLYEIREEREDIDETLNFDDIK